MLTYTDADAILRASRKGEKRIRNNTTLFRLDDETIGVRLHHTTVVSIHKDGTFTLRSGGWRSATTKERINRYGPAYVSQRNFEWYVGGFMFFDGIKVDGAGRVLNADPALAVPDRKRRRLSV